LNNLTIRPATAADVPDLRRALIELQNFERRLHNTRLPGEQIANAYVAWLRRQAARKNGALLIAEADEVFVGFAAGWIVEDHNMAETADSNRFGYVSDICVMPASRGRRIAAELLAAIEQHLARAGIARVRLASLAANIAAQAAYQRAGFTPYEIVFEKPISTQAE
jgi:ribosomal protein S18 acetylase RimI-like enzyme